MSNRMPRSHMDEYPLDVKCVNCRKTRGHHHSVTHSCPISRSRSGFTSYHALHFFRPKLPRLNKVLKSLIDRVANDMETYCDNQESLQLLDLMVYKLARLGAPKEKEFKI